MANNENINKVVYGNTTLIDLTEDSVTPETLLEGETAHDRSGAQITGTAKQGHSILNRIATALTQRVKLWFVDAEVTDDSTNGRTKVEIIKDGLTETQFDALSLDGSADGEYLVEGEGETYFDSTDVKHGNGTVKSELDKLNADIANRPRYISNQVLVNDILSSYTATQDCYVTVSGTYTVYVNGVAIAQSTAPFVVSLYLKAGQTVASEGANRYRAISLL